VLPIGRTAKNGNTMEVIKLDTGRYAKDCPECGEQQTYLRKWYAEASLKEGKICKGCANKKSENSGRIIYRGIRLSWLKKFETSAKLRGLDWEITVDDIADLYEDQEGKCALTGWEIGFPEVGHPQLSTVSIDRIDSAEDYTPENCEWVTVSENSRRMNEKRNRRGTI